MSRYKGFSYEDKPVGTVKVYLDTKFKEFVAVDKFGIRFYGFTPEYQDAFCVVYRTSIPVTDVYRMTGKFPRPADLIYYDKTSYPDDSLLTDEEFDNDLTLFDLNIEELAGRFPFTNGIDVAKCAKSVTNKVSSHFADAETIAENLVNMW